MPNFFQKLMRQLGAMDGPSADRDALVRAALLEHGDDGRSPRDTVFYFYGGDFAALAAEAKREGYAVRPAAKSDGIILSKTMPVDRETFAPVARQMEAWAETFGCEYDGWEAAVATRPH